MNECSKFWNYSDYLPLEQVVIYWCQQSGHSAAHCIEAKKSAIAKACEDGEISYKRTDGKTFEDPVYDLACRGLLAVDRDSFDQWITANFGDVSPLPAKPLATTERSTLLTIIAGLCRYSGIKHQERGAANQITKLTEELGAAVSDDTVRRILAKIPDALESRLK